MTLLSICIPTYNRKNYLIRLFQSIDFSEDIELVICDDGSYDDSYNLIQYYSQFLNINYFWQPNRGRSWALFNAINKCIGKYTLIMDSDDYFPPGALQKCIKVIQEHSNCQSFIFGLIIDIDGFMFDNLPPYTCVTTITAMRADLGWKHDLKEIVATNILRLSNYKPPVNSRRVPTSLIWEIASSYTKSLAVPMVLSAKVYLQDGMSSNLLKLQCSNPIPLIDLNLLYIRSSTFKSHLYRLKSYIQYGRFSLHAMKIVDSSLWLLPSLMLALPIFVVDLIRLNRKQK